MLCTRVAERSKVYLVPPNALPILIAVTTFFTFLGTIGFFQGSLLAGTVGLLVTLLVFTYLTCNWVFLISKESSYLFTSHERRALSFTLKLFISSEVLFFFSFFWSIFYFWLTPLAATGCCWPPQGIHEVFYGGVPLLNTWLLLMSGFSITWAHKAFLIENKMHDVFASLFMTLALAVAFTAVQVMEFLHVSYSIADSVYGSMFFISTGFHGLHVFIGTILILYCTLLCTCHFFTQDFFFGLLFAILYWHFVDVVWLFLFLVVYFW